MTAPQAHAERWFTLTSPGWRLPPADGLLTALPRQPTTDLHTARRALACGADGLLTWIATGPLPVTWVALRGLGVRAAVLTPAGTDEGRAVLAHQFALHLSALRSRSQATGPYLTSSAPPSPSPDAVRIPHLVALQHNQHLGDTVVWELMTRGDAYLWLGGPLPDQAYFERHLPGLVALRAAARAHQLPAGPPGKQLTRLLAHRYLSIRLVYQHPYLFRRLLADSRGTHSP
ncbi:hypothetical protein [Frankia sp. Cr1]|uniref:hypothetical protein n=1 Tax=Frankia sp. Cr1 TaxID=3073931 RepID=UPI002AD3FAF9|nr:hypothetical protein [Frankia sp. Cr1]